MSLISELKTLITADATQFISTMGKAQSSVSTFSSKLGGALKLFGVGLAINQVKNLTLGIDSAADASAKFGLSLNSWAKLEYIAGQADTTVENLSGGMKKLLLVLNKPTDASTSALNELNLDAQELLKLRPDEMLFSVYDAIRKVNDQNKQVGLVNGIWGKNGIEQINAARANIKGLTKEFEDLGLVISEKTIAQADRFDKAINKIAVVGKYAGGGLASNLGITDLVDKLAEAVVLANKLSSVLPAKPLALLNSNADTVQSTGQWLSGIAGKAVFNSISGQFDKSSSGVAGGEGPLESSIAKFRDIFKLVGSQIEKSGDKFESSIAKLPAILQKANPLASMLQQNYEDSISKQRETIFGDLTKTEYKNYDPFNQALRDTFKAIKEGKDDKNIEFLFGWAKELSSRTGDMTTNKINEQFIDELRNLKERINPDKKDPIKLDIQINTEPGFAAKILKDPSAKSFITDGVKTALTGAATSSGG